ncbi:MAG: SRPBCC family protein [Candidatus Ranarchaeia archaeon]
MEYPFVFTAYIEINAPPEFVFDFLVDPMRIGKHVPEHGCEKIISEVKRGKGVKSVWRMNDGSTWTEEITEAERPWHITFVEERGVVGQYWLKPAEDGKGTELDASQAFKKLMASNKWHREHVMELLENIKKFVEDEYSNKSP